MQHHVSRCSPVHLTPKIAAVREVAAYGTLDAHDHGGH
jgi:hypothetical protein